MRLCWDGGTSSKSEDARRSRLDPPSGDPTWDSLILMSTWCRCGKVGFLVRSYEKNVLCKYGQAKKKKNHRIVIRGRACIQRTAIGCGDVKTRVRVQKMSVVFFVPQPLTVTSAAR